MGSTNEKLTGSVKEIDTLQAVVSPCETLVAKVSADEKLTSTLSTQQSLQASLSAKKTVTGKMYKVGYVVDSELSHESTNPVQNKVITSELDKKIETLHIAKNTDIDKLFK